MLNEDWEGPSMTCQFLRLLAKFCWNKVAPPDGFFSSRAFPRFSSIPPVSLSLNLWNFTFRPSNLLHLHSLLATAVYQEFSGGGGIKEKLFEKNFWASNGGNGTKYLILVFPCSVRVKVRIKNIKISKLCQNSIKVNVYRLNHQWKGKCQRQYYL